MKKFGLHMGIFLLMAACLLGQASTSEAAAKIQFKLQRVFMQDGQEIIRGTFDNTGDSAGAVTRMAIDVQLGRNGKNFFWDKEDFRNLWIPVQSGEQVVKDFIVVLPEKRYQEPRGKYRSHGSWTIHWKNL